MMDNTKKFIILFRFATSIPKTSLVNYLFGNCRDAQGDKLTKTTR